MWTCTFCDRSFEQTSQKHSCLEQSVKNLCLGKSYFTVGLFDQFVRKCEEIDPIKIHATKSMVVISSGKAFAYVIQLGKNFIDILFTFKERYEDNLCFRKITSIPGAKDYNHHIRMMHADDLNDEVLKFMQIAYQNAKK